MPTPLPTNNISLKKIAELKNNAFFVPRYQRGYRWTPQQVTELLEDLNSFHARDKDSFYCLQPVLVKRRQDKWELIDGQQRLTTIYLLLDYLEGAKEPGYEPLFSLEYETRPDSAAYLRHVTAERASDNIDYYYLHQSLTCIQAWFRRQPVRLSAISKLSLTLLEQTRLIWYELDPASGGEQEAFIRINSRKIPLTSAELIRALFLKRPAGGGGSGAAAEKLARRQLELATEWDAIEARLQQDELWYFLNRWPQAQATRINYLFDLLAATDAAVPSAEPGELATFYYFHAKLAEAAPADLHREWQRLKALFLRLEQWYQQPDLYHWLGYLITVGVPVRELVAQAEHLTKQDFAGYVRQRLRATVQGTLEQGLLEDWTYTDAGQRGLLQNALLLFNIETLRSNQASSYRFPFRYYKGGGQGGRTWSLEHINAQSPRGLGNQAAYRSWLEEASEFVDVQALAADPPPTDQPATGRETAAQVRQALAALLRQPEITKDDFEALQPRIFRLFGEPELHTIDNLALLAGSDNSALGNGTFPQKRAKIVALEKEGSFIPIATRNVFLKYYSPPAQMHLAYWGEADRRAYVAAIRRTLGEYLTPAAPSPTHAH
jgi:hypothetical protein